MHKEAGGAHYKMSLTQRMTIGSPSGMAQSLTDENQREKLAKEGRGPHSSSSEHVLAGGRMPEESSGHVFFLLKEHSI